MHLPTAEPAQYTYTNIQLPLITPTSPLMINAAAAKIYGVDGELEFRLTDALRPTSGFQFNHQQYTSFPSAAFGTVTGAYRWSSARPWVGSTIWKRRT